MAKMCYTKHHLKFGKIKPTILNIWDSNADFFLYFIGVQYWYNIGIKCLSNKKSGSELDRTAFIFNCVYQS